MRSLVSAIIACAIAAGCGVESNSGEGQTSAAQASSSYSRGGTITVGEQSFTFVPSIQCSVYPNNQVNIAGHTAEDESLEVTIDYYPENDGPIGVILGTDGRDGSWFSSRESTKFEIDGRQVRGTTTFTEFRGGNGKSAEGSFEIRC